MARWLNIAGNGRVSIAGQVRASAMAVVKVIGEDPSEMAVVENDAMIKAFATDRSNDSLDIRRLPRRTVCDQHFLDAHVLDTLAERVAVDRIPITDQEPRRLVLGKRFDDLLGCPLSRRMRSDVKVDDHTATMTEYDETEQDAACRCRNSEAINGDDIANVVIQEGAPRLPRRFAMPDLVFVYGSLRRLVAKELQLRTDSRRSPVPPENPIQARNRDSGRFAGISDWRLLGWRYARGGSRTH